MEYSKSLKEHRESRGYTQSRLAKETGLTQQMISWWEDEKGGYPSIKQCVVLADFYGISVDELIDHDVKKNW